ncbi:MAG: hypothetical protein J7L03_06635 [Caldisericaceae bacterium]|nr:hypothetical protein [Caldisericaceae bacterium]
MAGPTTIGGAIGNFLGLFRAILIIASIIAVIFTGVHIASENNNVSESARAKRSLKVIIIVVIGVALIGGIGAFLFHEAGTSPHIQAPQGSGGGYSSAPPAFQIKNKNGFARWLYNIISGIIGFGVEIISNGFLVPVYTTAFNIGNKLLCTVPDPFAVFAGNVGAGHISKIIFYPLAIYAIIFGIMVAYFLMLSRSSQFSHAEGKNLFYKVFIAFLLVLATGYLIGIMNTIGTRLAGAILHLVHPSSLWRITYGQHGSAHITLGIGDIIQNAGQNLINAFINWTKNPNGVMNLHDAFQPYIPPHGAWYFSNPSQGIIIGIMSILQVTISLGLLFVGIFRIVYYYILVAIAPFMLATAAVPGQEKTAMHWIKDFFIVSLLPAFYSLVFYFLVIMGKIVVKVLGIPESGMVTTPQAVAASLTIYLSTAVVGFYLFKNGSRILGEFFQHARSFIEGAVGAASGTSSAGGLAIAAGGAVGSTAVSMGASAFAPIGGAIAAGANKLYRKLNGGGSSASNKIPGGTMAAGIGSTYGSGPSVGGVSTGLTSSSSNAGSASIGSPAAKTDNSQATGGGSFIGDSEPLNPGSSDEGTQKRSKAGALFVATLGAIGRKNAKGQYVLEEHGRIMAKHSQTMARLSRDAGRFTGFSMRHNMH